ncbi:MAG: hypothetical protein HY815_18750, partial [Candidatus Riflebacteria bacterium]|nr:hypothetical protein [Candidatus Riflebacteria bacterium]
DLAGLDNRLPGHDPNIQIGIGAHLGCLRSGLLGGPSQRVYCALGRHVGLTLELTEAAGWGELLASDDLARLIEGQERLVPREPLRSQALNSIVRIHAVETRPASGRA